MKRASALLLCGPCLAFAATVIGQTHPSQPSHPLTISEIVQRTSNAVVQVVVSDKSGKEFALGSGFLVSPAGKIVTNHHVIEGGYSAVAKLANGSYFPIKGVLTASPDADLVLLEIEGRGLPFLTLESTSNVEVGEHVVAIGSPLGLEATVSDGIVSAFRHEDPNRDWIQTTAPVSHGNSGGPLLDMHGKVVGVITAGLEQGQNLNFAIPSDEVKSLLSAQGDLVSIEEAGAKRSGGKDESVSGPDDSEQRAIEQLRTIAELIKTCTKYPGLKPGLVDGVETRNGPPTNVVWNVEPASSVRARYLGSIEYEVPIWTSPESDPTAFCANEAARGTMNEDDCWGGYLTILKLYVRMKANPKRYRYEFDVTPRGLEFLRGFDKLRFQEDEPWAPAGEIEKCAGEAIKSTLGSTGSSQ